MSRSSDATPCPSCWLSCAAAAAACAACAPVLLRRIAGRRPRLDRRRATKASSMKTCTPRASGRGARGRVVVEGAACAAGCTPLIAVRLAAVAAGLDVIVRPQVRAAGHWPSGRAGAGGMNVRPVRSRASVGRSPAPDNARRRATRGALKILCIAAVAATIVAVRYIVFEYAPWRSSSRAAPVDTLLTSTAHSQGGKS